MLAVCALISAIGFYKFVYFLSVGYALAVCGAGIAILCLCGSKMTWAGIAMCALLVIYGIRLGGFLLLREAKSASYRKALDKATGKDKPMPVFVKLAIWICVALMYVMQVSPVFYRAVNGDKGGIMPIVALAVMMVALIMETAADMQKSNAKKRAPKRFCDTALFKIVRCPNYFGEVLFWTGVFISGFGALQGLWQWVIASAGYILLSAA